MTEDQAEFVCSYIVEGVLVQMMRRWMAKAEHAGQISDETRWQLHTVSALAYGLLSGVKMTQSAVLMKHPKLMLLLSMLNRVVAESESRDEITPSDNVPDSFKGMFGEAA